jgi:voltage-gated potassium channel
VARQLCTPPTFSLTPSLKYSKQHLMTSVIFIFLRRMRLPLIILILVYALATLGLTLVPGQDDQGNLHYLSFFHAFYFVSFMGSTIGFGEIPYPFTDPQRVWVLVGIYTSVIAWLYTIGSLLTLFQDPAFKRAITFQGFRNKVKRQREHFWIICGLGTTGHALMERLIDNNINVVVIDSKQSALDALELVDYGGSVPALLADMTIPENLVAAGIVHKDCVGVISLASDDNTNLKVAVVANQLQGNPNLTVICRSESEDATRNMKSFGTNVVLNPFQTFANQFGLAIHDHQLYTLSRWLTDNGEKSLSEDKAPPAGHWIICGYGRLGKSLETILKKRKIEVTVVDPEPKSHQAPRSCVVGRGTEADTLIKADLATASGIVAATSDDSDNLSIVMTAKELRRDLFTIARLNSFSNDVLFRAAELDLVIRRNEVLADRILAIVDRPLVTQFLRLAHQLPKQTIENLMSSIRSNTGGSKPVSWRYSISSDQTPAISQMLAKNSVITIGDLIQQPNTKDKQAIPLLLVEDGSTKLLPELTDQVLPNQQFLFCGTGKARRNSLRLCEDVDLLDQILKPDRSAIPGIRLFFNYQQRAKPGNSSPESNPKNISSNSSSK